MIHFSERLQMSNDYYKWIEETKERTGIEIKDCPLSVISFLEEKGFLHTGMIHKKYLPSLKEGD